MRQTSERASEEIANQLRDYIARRVEAGGGSTVSKKPSHRVKFVWPPHPVSYSFHILASDWSGKASFEAHGEVFEVIVADTPFGVFGRCKSIWHEARGDTQAEMLENLKQTAEPLFSRQLVIGETLEIDHRFVGHIPELSPLDQLKLLFCEDRDVANEARAEIESHSCSGLFFNGLIAILDDRTDPHRRSAQWCVLDIFESLSSITRDADDELEAVRAMKALIWNAEDDHARTIYKAGVVLGGHLPDLHGRPTLLECLNAPSKIGRRSAIHGLFHVVEWLPESRSEVVSALRVLAENDPEPVLREFARSMADDIAAAASDHRREPVFEDEP